MKRLILACIMSVVVALGIPSAIIVSAETAGVTNELKSFNVSIDGIVEDTKANPTLLFVNELGFDVTNDATYKLSIYLYVPDRTAIPGTYNNTVNMAIGYDGSGAPNLYANVPIVKTGVSDGSIAGLVYRFEVEHSALYVNAKSLYMNGYERRYDFSGITIYDYAGNATEYALAHTYYFTESIDGTLLYRRDTLDVVALDVYQTYYRTQTSEKGDNWQKQIASCFFSIPNSYLERYGSLRQIACEWYQYRTRPMIVTDSPSIYDALSPYVGISCSASNPNALRSRDSYFISTTEGVPSTYMYGYNNENSGLLAFHTAYCAIDNPIDPLYYLFYTDNLNEYNPYSESSELVSSDTLLNYIKNYPTNNNILPCKNGMINADLFEAVTNGYGKNEVVYTADLDIQTLKTWSSSNPSFLDTWTEYGFLTALGDFLGIDVSVNESGDTLPAIQVVEYTDIYRSINVERNYDDIVNDLYVNYNDVGVLAQLVSNAYLTDESVYMLRYDVSDYYCEGIAYTNGTDVSYDECVLAIEDVYIDFDIIYLTFGEDGNTVLPVVADPTDNIGGITGENNEESEVIQALTDEFDTLKKLIGLIIGITAVILIFSILLTLFDFIVPAKMYKKRRRRRK